MQNLTNGLAGPFGLSKISLGKILDKEAIKNLFEFSLILSARAITCSHFTVLISFFGMLLHPLYSSRNAFDPSRWYLIVPAFSKHTNFQFLMHYPRILTPLHVLPFTLRGTCIHWTLNYDPLKSIPLSRCPFTHERHTPIMFCTFLSNTIKVGLAPLTCWTNPVFSITILKLAVTSLKSLHTDTSVTWSQFSRREDVVMSSLVYILFVCIYDLSIA